MILPNAVANTATLCIAAALLLACARGEENATTPPPPSSHQILPPSDDFCTYNSLGDDTYISFFEPCEFIFYDSTVMPEHFSCGDFLKDNESNAIVVVKQQKRKVMMWPDSCVANGPRCYNLSQNPHLSNYTLYENTEYAMEFPAEATIVSVNCSADFVRVQEFTDNIPESWVKVTREATFGIALFFFSAMACLVAGICCCCGACNDRYGGRRSSYQMVESKKYHGPPVVATKCQDGPVYQAIV
mmetsp:Transcript_14651/g.20010  ORF Transcript_14651/g.20010 Transcript_14651/m.20010 type:complete len:244 (-) Transcript_14651:70-801(-)